MEGKFETQQAPPAEETQDQLESDAETAEPGLTADQEESRMKALYDKDPNLVQDEFAFKAAIGEKIDRLANRGILRRTSLSPRDTKWILDRLPGAPVAALTRAEENGHGEALEFLKDEGVLTDEDLSQAEDLQKRMGAYMAERREILSSGETAAADREELKLKTLEEQQAALDEQDGDSAARDEVLGRLRGQSPS